MKIIETKGKFRKSKAYGLIGCLALFSVMVASPVINAKAEETNSNISNTNTVTEKGHLDTEPYTTTRYKEGMEISKDPGDKYGYFTDYKSNFLFKYQYFNEDGSISYKYFKTWTETYSNGEPKRTYFPQGANDELSNISDLKSGIIGDKERNYGDNEEISTASEEANELYAVDYTEHEPTLSETGETIPSTEKPEPNWKSSSVQGPRILYKGDKGKLAPGDKGINFTWLHIGLKTKVEREKVEDRPVRYIKNETIQPNEKNTLKEGKDKYKITTIEYNYENRDLTNEEYERIINVEKNIPTVENGQVKETRTITYEESEEKLIEVGTPKPKTDITNLPSPIRYVKDDTKEKGLPNERIEGKTGKSTVITTYDVNQKTGDIIENVGEPVVENPKETIIKVPAKTKVELIKKDGKVIEKTTIYDVDPENGNITETVTERIISDNNPEKPPVLNVPEYKSPLSTNTPVDDNGNLILPPVVDELPNFNGGVNSIEPPVEEKPEYTGPLSTNTPVDDNGNLILPPVVELPEFNGGVNSIEPPVEEKPEYKLPEKPKEEPIKETPKEETKVEDKKEKELPNTNSASVLTSLISSVIGTLGLGYKSKRRK